jgi:hypothetical protein
LPNFLKAGVYYSQKLESVRKQGFYPKLFAFELIRNDANNDFVNKNYDRACRKYEEAYAMFRYYYSTNPKWSEEGIDDTDLKHFDDQGTSEFEQKEILKIKK